MIDKQRPFGGMASSVRTQRDLAQVAVAAHAAKDDVLLAASAEGIARIPPYSFCHCDDLALLRL